MTDIKIPESLFDAVHEMIAIKDHDYGIIQYNTAGYNFFNTTYKKIKGKKCYEFSGRNSPCDTCALRECYRTKKPAWVEKYVKEMDVWLLVRAYPILDGNGKIVKVIEHFHDVSRRKNMEMRLLMLERAVDQTIEGIAVADMDGYNQFVNSAWAQIHGYTVEEMLHANMSSFHPPDQLEETVIPFIDQVMKTGSNQDESEHTRKDGTLFPTWMTVNVIKDDDGHPLGIVGTVRDITEQKMAEKKLINYRDHLEKMVEDRTSELITANKNLTDALSKIQALKDRLEAENINLRAEIKLEHNFEEIIGQSDPLKYVLYRIQEVAPTDSTVIILGQTGTGKELVARAIHNNSSRKSRPLVKIDCAALPATLIESELFGHEKGAFSGAVQKRKGRFEIADGSTLFLDEIGELALELQGKLLRVMEEGQFERLGSSKTLHTNVRVVAATNRNLQEEVKKGRFRADLWYRLNVYSIKIPALKDRAEDIPLLVEWFVAKFSRKLGKTIKIIPQRTMRVFQNYHWPGNIRELSNMIESSLISCHDETLQIPDMPDTPEHDSKGGVASMAEMETEYIMNAIETCQWRIEGKDGAAELLGMNPGTLRGRMRKYGINRPLNDGE